jgi:hypothetical protein
LGRSHPIKRSPDRLRSQTSPGITEHRPNIFRAFPGISGHRRTRNDHRVPYRPSPVTPSRMARRGGIARRRIACDQARRVRDSPSPDTASGMVVACRIVRRRIVCRRARCRITYRHVPARVSDLGVPPVPPVGRAEGPSSAMPRPNSRLSPTPPAAVYEHVFLCCAVALHHGAFGGAAKADCWAALIPLSACRTSGSRTLEQSGHILGIFPGIFPGIVGHEMIVACGRVCRRSRRPVWPVAAG